MRSVLLLSVFALALVGCVSVADLNQAIEAGDTAKMRELIAKKPSLVNARENWGFTPLMHAAMSGQIEATTLLLDSGADVDAYDTKGLATAKEHAQGMIKCCDLSWLNEQEAWIRQHHYPREEEDRQIANLRSHNTPEKRQRLEEIVHILAAAEVDRRR